MSSTDRKAANAIGGKTARACDSCLLKRARWYCAADDAFLCQGCDASVHSANQLASRHERVRLGTASNKQHSESKTLESVPAWHKGFTRKARTPRQHKLAQKDKERSANNIFCASPLVPDLGDEDVMFEETEAQLLYRVPVLDPFSAELCNVSNETEKEQMIRHNEASNVMFANSGNDDMENLHVFLPSDMELADFAADVETLLGTGLEEEGCGIEGLGGLMDHNCKEENDDCLEGGRVKVEDDEQVQAIIACSFEPGPFDLSKGSTLDWDFDYESPVEVEEKVEVVEAEARMMNDGCSNEMKKKRFLRLNYEEVIVAWDNQGCPWTSGIRPEFNPDDCWPDFMAINAPGSYNPYGSSGGRACSDGGREARVSRYREKRRTRLFSKKIRYEVRKLNAEKRPRMKGRFVKRTSFAGVSTSTTIPTTYLINK